jgi:soluble P-type ATPase
LKADLRFYNEQMFGNVESQENSLLEELQVLGGLEEKRVLCIEDKLRKTIVIGELKKATLLEEIVGGKSLGLFD